MSVKPLRHVMRGLTVSAVLCGAAPRGAGDLPGLPFAASPAEPSSAARPADDDPPAGDDPADPASDDLAIRAQQVCVGSTVHSAGELGPALLYRRARLPDGRLEVGYYAFFSEERPWGNNWLTWTVLPALAIDLVYTRGLLVAPGLQRAKYGPADVEGFRVIYAAERDGGLRVESAVADDERHRRAELSRADLFAADPARITLATSTWSHHLGARVRAPSDLVYRRCYGSRSIRPIDREVVRRFHLERRAGPALAAGILQG